MKNITRFLLLILLFINISCGRYGSLYLPKEEAGKGVIINQKPVN